MKVAKTCDPKESIIGHSRVLAEKANGKNRDAPTSARGADVALPR